MVDRARWMMMLLLDALLGVTCAGCRRRASQQPCARCAREVHSQPRHRGATFVDRGAARSLVRAVKYGRWRSGASWFSRELVTRLEDDVRYRIVAVCGVAPHPRHVRRRGIDVPGRVAKHAARQLRVPALDLLVRDPRSAPQRGADRARRRRNARASFDVRDDVDVRIARARIDPLPDGLVLLVDDVCTTGATLDACSALLRVVLRRHLAFLDVEPHALVAVPERDRASRGVVKSVHVAHKSRSGDSLTVPIWKDLARLRRRRITSEQPSVRRESDDELLPNRRSVGNPRRSTVFFNTTAEMLVVRGTNSHVDETARSTTP